MDYPGLLYHVIVRGIERRNIFEDNADKESFLSRLGMLLNETATPLYAFALLSNHAHLLLHRGQTPLSTIMRRLLTGYALYFNKRHRREGHLFQNRYKAIICQEDTYFLELVRYIHLNPIRAGLVEDTVALRCYPYSGHAYLLGRRAAEWCCADVALARFGATRRQARAHYERFVAEGVSHGRRAELVGGGLKRLLGLSRDYPKEHQSFDDRILGAGEFVEAVYAQMQAQPCLVAHGITEAPTFEALLIVVCEQYGVSAVEVLGSSRQKSIVNARSLLALKMRAEMGLSASDIASRLGVTRSAATKMIKRGESLRQLSPGNLGK